MREMKDSGVEWIGEIPKDWETAKFKFFLSIIGGCGFKEEYQGESQGDYPFLKASDINGSERTVSSAKNYVNQNLVKQEKYNVVPSCSIIIAKIGEALKKNHRKINTCDCIIDNNCEAFSLIPSADSDISYLYYVLSQIDMVWFDNGGTVPSVNNEKLRDFFLPNPSNATQHRIADYLDAKCAQIDRAIARQQEVIEKLKEYKLSVITEAVTKGLNPNVPMKDSGIEWIGEIPEGWDLLKLRFAVENIGDIDHYMPASVDIGVPYVMTGDLHDLASAINFQECKMVSTEDYVELSSKIAIKKGDLLFARYATIGTICYVDVDREFLVSYSCVIIKPNEDLMLGKFLYYVMKSNTFAEEVKQYTNSNTQGNVGIEALYRSKVVVPSVSLQKEIIEFLEEKCTLIDKSIDSKMGLAKKLEEYKKSLIYEVVTGKREM